MPNLILTAYALWAVVTAVTFLSLYLQIPPEYISEIIRDIPPISFRASITIDLKI